MGADSNKRVRNRRIAVLATYAASAHRRMACSPALAEASAHDWLSTMVSSDELLSEHRVYAPDSLASNLAVSYFRSHMETCDNAQHILAQHTFD